MNIFIPTKNNNFKFKLGKKPKLFDKRTLQLKCYLPQLLPKIPDNIDWGSKIIEWPLFLNDSIGDCTIVGVFNLIRTWDSNTSGLIEFTDNEALKYYELLGDYNPQDSATDNGCTEISILKFWKNMGFNSHKIDSFVEVNLNNLDHVRFAIWAFGGIYLGWDLPNSCQSDSNVWEIIPTGNLGEWGGHCTIANSYNSDGSINIISWGRKIKVTPDFFTQFCDEAYAIVSKDFIKNNDNLSPSGFDIETLENDLKLVS